MAVTGPLSPLHDAPLAPDLPERLAAHAPRVVVVGDAVLDCWMAGPSRRLSREAPVPVVEVDRTHSAAGGAANTAVNLAAMGARVSLVSVVGDDADGVSVRELVEAAGVDTSEVRVRVGYRTPAKRRIVADDALVARFDTVPDPATADPEDDPAVPRAVGRAVAGGVDAVVVCDYASGARGGPVVDALAELRADSDAVLYALTRPAGSEVREMVVAASQETSWP